MGRNILVEGERGERLPVAFRDGRPHVAGDGPLADAIRKHLEGEHVFTVADPQPFPDGPSAMVGYTEESRPIRSEGELAMVAARLTREVPGVRFVRFGCLLYTAGELDLPD